MIALHLHPGSGSASGEDGWASGNSASLPGALSREERHQVAEAKGCCPAVQIVRLRRAVRVYAGVISPPGQNAMVRQVILGEQAEVAADDDRTRLEKASTVLMEAVHASSASPWAGRQ